MIIQLRRNTAATLTILATAASIALTSCSPGENGFQVAKPPAKKRTTAEVPANNLEKSDILTDEGEALVEPKSFDQALGKFNEALQLNPENNRALFWSGFLKPFLQMKGILRRVRPLYKNDTVRYAKFVQGTLANKSPEMGQFLKAGPEDITTGDDLQEWLDRIDDAMTESRTSFKKIRNSEITVLAPTGLFPNLGMSGCSETRFGPITYKDQTCANASATTIGLARPDFDVLLSWAGGMQVMLEIYTAYRINPAALIVATESEASKKNSEEMLKSIFDIRNSGASRGRVLHQLKPITSELLASLQWIMENQAEACPKGTYQIDSRRGFLVNFGVCLDMSNSASGAERNFRTLEAIVAGKPIDVVYKDRVAAQILPLKIAEEPLGSLHDLGPFEINDCGHIANFNSKALQPYFAKGSFEDVKEPVTCNKTVAK